MGDRSEEMVRLALEAFARPGHRSRAGVWWSWTSSIDRTNRRVVDDVLAGGRSGLAGMGHANGRGRPLHRANRRQCASTSVSRWRTLVTGEFQQFSDASHWRSGVGLRRGGAHAEPQSLDVRARIGGTPPPALSLQPTTHLRRSTGSYGGLAIEASRASRLLCGQTCSMSDRSRSSSSPTRPPCFRASLASTASCRSGWRFDALRAPARSARPRA